MSWEISNIPYYFQIEVAEKMFNRRSAFDYACMEGTILSRFMSTYIQTKDWNVSCWYGNLIKIVSYISYIFLFSAEELCSRLPTPEEVNVYQIENETVSIFLPVGYEEGEERYSV